MEQRRLGGFHPLNEERDRSLRDFTRKLAVAVRRFELPGDDIRCMLHLGRERFEDDPGIVSRPANEVPFHGIDDVDGRHDADTPDDDPGARWQSTSFVYWLYRVGNTTK